MVMGEFQKSRVFNSEILVKSWKSQKFDAREM